MQYLVSILIPTYNRAVLLRRAIESALKQNYDNIEIVISDNCSTDSTNEIVYSFIDNRIRYFGNEKNVGPILNWRLALERAKGDLSVILCDDDYFLDERYIENAVKLFNKYSSINLVITDCVLGKANREHITHLGLPEYVRGLTFFRNFWTKNYSIPVISNVFKTSKALELEAFKDNEILYSDIELWLKLMLNGDVGYISNPSVYYNFHGDNIVINLSREQIIKNSRLVGNIRTFLRKNNYDHSFIENWTSKFIYRYIFFTSSIRNLKMDFQLYKNIACEIGCNHSYPKYFSLTFYRIIRFVRGKIGKLIRKIFKKL